MTGNTNEAVANDPQTMEKAPGIKSSTDNSNSSNDDTFPSPSDGEEEKALVRKIDLRLLPAIWLMYLLSYIDRTNIGNAKVAGLQDDLHLSSGQYSLALIVFFITYVLFEVPSKYVHISCPIYRWAPPYPFSLPSDYHAQPLPLHNTTIPLPTHAHDPLGRPHSVHGSREDIPTTHRRTNTARMPRSRFLARGHPAVLVMVQA